MNTLKLGTQKFSVSQDTNGSPMWVHIRFENAIDAFGIMLKPEEFKILVAWLSAESEFNTKLERFKQ